MDERDMNNSVDAGASPRTPAAEPSMAERVRAAIEQFNLDEMSPGYDADMDRAASAAIEAVQKSTDATLRKVADDLKTIAESFQQDAAAIRGPGDDEDLEREWEADIAEERASTFAELASTLFTLAGKAGAGD